MKMQKLVILWTSESEDNFFNVATPFILDAIEGEWFHDIVILIWGASTQTLAKVPSIKTELGIFKQKNVVVKCCLQSAEKYGIEEDLAELNIPLVEMSFVLKNYMSGGARIISI